MDWTVFWVFGSITAIVISVTYVRFRLRMEMLRKGNNGFVGTPSKTGSISLLAGIFTVAVGCASIINSLFHYFGKEFLIIGLYCILCGIALLVYWKLTTEDREQKCRWYEHILSRKNY
ncbi:hypothetical protein LLG96_14515 [bacterium]|nr:hypothetical protein [bacterium]